MATQHPAQDPVTELIVLIVASAIVVMTIILVFVLLGQWGRNRESRVAQATMRSGLTTVSDLPAVTGRVSALLEPLEPNRPERAFSLTVGGRDAFLYEWRTTYGGWFGQGARVPDEYRRAYVIFIPGAPYLRVTPKGLFGKPANSVDLKADDRAFARAFHVEGSDEEAIRRYLGPELRRFLLGLSGTWGFLAGTEGVALVAFGQLSETEVPQTASILERLATVAHAASRR
jgi:hypothetical protein